MAFVYKAEQNTALSRAQTAQHIGPGAYVGHNQYTGSRGFAPFNSKVGRGGQSNTKSNKEQVPGPGAYEIGFNNTNEKVVVSSANEDIKIVEVPKPQSNFKSQTKRFSDKTKNSEGVPGPGQYEALQPFEEIIIKGQAKNQMAERQNIVERLMKMNKYQSTPSIPSKLHTYGYTENPSNDLTLNKMPVKQHTGVLRDSVGPGQYEMKDCFTIAQNKGSAWHKYKEARLQDQNKHGIQVGPGAYDVQYIGLPLYKMKQSAGFASRTVRSMEGKRGPKQASMYSISGVKNTKNSAQLANLLEDNDSEEEILEDYQPGPGHYFPENSHPQSQHLVKSNSHGNFGSLSKRFGTAGPAFGNPIGPGEYNPSVAGVIGKNPNDIKKRNPPFLSSDTRFIVKKIEETKPGPGAYEPRINLEDKLIQKIQKGYRGNFGTTERRFKREETAEQSEQPGPGAYIEVLQQPKEDDAGPVLTSVFRSASKRSAFQGTRDQKPPVGSYKLDYYNIEKKVNQEPEDPDLKIKVPNLGFSTSQQRFKTVQSKPVAELDEDEEDQNAANNRIKEEVKLENRHFNTKAERFNYKVKNPVPAPGTYHDTNTNPWSKRTFNINFADF